MATCSNVLFVDDDDAVTGLVAKSLKKHLGDQIQVTTILDSVEAGPWIRKNRPEIVITDLEMPIVDGFALSREVRECNPASRIIVFSGSAEQHEEQLLASGLADSCVSKSRGIAPLVASVKKAIRELAGHQKAQHMPDAPEARVPNGGLAELLP